MTLRSRLLSGAFAAVLGAAALPGLAVAEPAQDWLAGTDASAAASKVTYSGAPIEAKFGHPAPPSSAATPVWQATVDRLTKVTNGKLAFKVFGGGTLLGAKDGFKAVRGGVAEWATCYVSQEGRPFALSKVWEQPGVTPANPMVATRISQELAAKYTAPEFTKQGVAWSGQAVNTPSDLMSKKPVRKLEDLKGMKVIFQGSVPELAKALGFTQVNVAFPEIYTALQQGVADAVLWVDAGFIPYKIFEVAKYHTTLGLTGGGISQCYSKEWFDKLPPDLQAVFYNTQEPEVMAMSQVTMVDYGKKAEQTYKDKGVEMITLSDADRKALSDRTGPLVDAWAADLDKDHVPAKDYLADIKRLTAKYQSMTPDQLMRLSITSPVQGIR